MKRARTLTLLLVLLLSLAIRRTAASLPSGSGCDASSPAQVHRYRSGGRRDSTLRLRLSLTPLQARIVVGLIKQAFTHSREIR